jgi:hypothetical protein
MTLAVVAPPRGFTSVKARIVASGASNITRCVRGPDSFARLRAFFLCKKVTISILVFDSRAMRPPHPGRNASESYDEAADVA